MKLLTTNKIELSQDRLNLEQKIGEQLKELSKLEWQVKMLADKIECDQNTLMMIDFVPNRYLRMKQANNSRVDIFELLDCANKLIA